jgi:hypothetical protein
MPSLQRPLEDKLTGRPERKEKTVRTAKTKGARPESPAPPALADSEYTEPFNDGKTCGSNSLTLDPMCADPTTPAERAEISSFRQAETRTVSDMLDNRDRLEGEMPGSTSPPGKLFCITPQPEHT